MPQLTDLPIRKIAVLRALKLGDFLVATPAFRALRSTFPEAHIDYVGLPWAQELARRYRDYFSGFVAFPGFPGLPEQEWKAEMVTAFLRHMQRQKYDLALQLHGQGTVSNICVVLWRARITAGFAPPNSVWPGQDWFMEYPEGQPEARRLLQLLEYCGLPSAGEDLVFPIEPDDKHQLTLIPSYKELKPPYVCIHPGATSSRPWAAEHFASVADACAEQGYTVVITGVADETAIARRVAKHMRHKPLIFTGKTSLGALAVLLQRAALFIGNDTGTSHLAVAVGTPSVTIFSTSDPKRWAPLDTTKHRVVLSETATSAAVVREAQELLEQRGGM